MQNSKGRIRCSIETMTHSSGRDCRFAYGLSFDCDFPLPDLPPCPSQTICDVRIEQSQPLSLAQVEAMIAPDNPIENVLVFTENESRILFSQVGRFSIQGGQRIVVEPLEGTSASSWRLPLLGGVLALLLEARGLFALHAGTVEMPGPDGTPVACAFAGDKGQGKSTLGAALSLAGFPLLGDDLLALQMPEDRKQSPLALVGFGAMKLVPDAVRAVLGQSPEDLPEVAPELVATAGLDKRHFVAPLAKEARPLHHLFILASHDDDERDDVSLRALSPQEALALMLPHTFAARWGDLYLKSARRATHFRASAQLVGSCRVWELSRRRDFALLPQTIELLARTAASE